MLCDIQNNITSLCFNRLAAVARFLSLPTTRTSGGGGGSKVKTLHMVVVVIQTTERKGNDEKVGRGDRRRINPCPRLVGQQECISGFRGGGGL